ncbi:MAG TPA: DUF1801 domain-containing protein [Chloroflexota bacterium]|nr:DUF1801 domain-containing protein [Chloroflexota bacterium]
MIDEGVQKYIDNIDAEQRPLFDRVHSLIMETCPDAQVALSYNMPTYRLAKRRLFVGMWKHGVSMYGWPQDADAGFTERHPDLRTSKGTIRLTPEAAEGIADDELRDLVRAALTS